jgi:hypothetical protein
MTNYDKLDYLIVQAVGTGANSAGHIQSDPSVDSESKRIADATSREQFRVIDGRLQALRKRGVIRYANGRGWVVGDKK